jgi:hypothetical protein
MPTDGSIRLINHRNSHCRQPIANLICRCKVALLSGRLALLNQVSDASSTKLTEIVSAPL